MSLCVRVCVCMCVCVCVRARVHAMAVRGILGVLRRARGDRDHSHRETLCAASVEDLRSNRIWLCASNVHELKIWEVTLYECTRSLGLECRPLKEILKF